MALSPVTQTAFDLRLQWLEYVLQGAPSSLIPPDAAPSTSTGSPQDEPVEDPRKATLANKQSVAAGVQRRTLELEDMLRDALAASGHDGLKRFAANYDSYSSLVFPSNPPAQPSTPDHSLPSSSTPGLRGGPPKAQTLEAALLPYQSKADLAISAGQDLVELERGLREVDLLVRRGASGSGALAGYEALIPRLQAAQAQHQRNLASHTAKQQAVASVLDKYNDYITTVSKLFVGLHQHVTELEEAVGKEERRRKEEAQEKY